MKALILLAALSSISSAFACMCVDYPLSPEPAIKEYIGNHFHHQSIVGEMKWIAYYPTLEERMFWSSTRGTSCEGSGPNGEILAFCAGSRKSDYLVKLKDCEVVIRAKSDYTSVSLKELSSTCK